MGGNAYGIFIHSVQKDSIADDVGLRVGDQILEYNGTDLRRATAEYAAFELAKPADKVTALIQYNIQSELLNCRFKENSLFSRFQNSRIQSNQKQSWRFLLHSCWLRSTRGVHRVAADLQQGRCALR